MEKNKRGVINPDIIVAKCIFKLYRVVLLTVVFISCNEPINGKDDENKPIPYNSIGVYGGSLSYVADTAKSFWQDNLGIEVITHSVNGAGFTNYTNVSISTQIDQSPSHDISILWCSTNDFSFPVEDDNTHSPMTQNGGMRLSIEKLKAKNPNGIILGFCSLPCFDGRNGTRHIEGQAKVFAEYDIPYLNQFDFFAEEDTSIMYEPDKVHLLEKGYIHIRERQLVFIKENI